MQFKVLLFCQSCQHGSVHTVRTSKDAGAFIQLAIACQECGSHGNNWFPKEALQLLFTNKIPKKTKPKKGGKK